jgi:hypothetical protein
MTQVSSKVLLALIFLSQIEHAVTTTHFAESKEPSTHDNRTR